MPVSASAFAFAALVVLLAAVPQAFAARLGGSYNVDDAEIGKVGSCEFETWGSFAANRDHIAVVSPACVVNLGGPIELGANLVDQRSNGDRDSFVALTAKAVPIPIQSGFGLAVEGAIVYDPRDRTGSGAIVNIPVTFELTDQFRFNVNFGAQFNSGDPRGLFTTGGVGFSWNFVPQFPQWSVLAEVYGLIGPGQAGPRYQSGIRYSPTNDIDWDVIYGRNLTGESANWITVALTVRIGDN
jgi:hypothetical protein